MSSPRFDDDRERLYREGKGDDEIAREIGKAPRAIYSWRYRTGRPANVRKPRCCRKLTPNGVI